MLAQLRPAAVLLLVMTVLTGLAYPFAMTGIAQAVFPHQADGSLILHDDTVIGSSLVAQSFAGDGYFHPRPSSAGAGYDAANSSGSNLGPTSAALIDAIRTRTEEALQRHGGSMVPVDLVTASGSGLDPHISPEAAVFQAARVAQARGMDEQAVQDLIVTYTEGPTLGLLGQPRVNVLELNLALDALAAGGQAE
jgi:K+-transporting ATPase ATPase C chain